MESDWALSQLSGMTDSMHLKFEEISWYSIKIGKLLKLGQDKPTQVTKFSIWYMKSQEYKY